MNAPFVSTDVYPVQWLRPTVEFLLASQRPDGEIPWFDGGHTDPWDHTEAAMGLSVAGELAAAERAYGWLAERQLDDGRSSVPAAPAQLRRRARGTAGPRAGGGANFLYYHFLS